MLFQIYCFLLNTQYSDCGVGKISRPFPLQIVLEQTCICIVKLKTFHQNELHLNW
jgi:hypothetical protein